MTAHSDPDLGRTRPSARTNCAACARSRRWRTGPEPDRSRRPRRTDVAGRGRRPETSRRCPRKQQQQRKRWTAPCPTARRCSRPHRNPPGAAGGCCLAAAWLRLRLARRPGHPGRGVLPGLAHRPAPDGHDVYDEAALSFAGHAVAQDGIWLSTRAHMQTETPGDYSKRYNWALDPRSTSSSWGNAYRLWGETETVARSVGLVCNALACSSPSPPPWRSSGRRRRPGDAARAAGVRRHRSGALRDQPVRHPERPGCWISTAPCWWRRSPCSTFFYVLLLRSPRPLRSPVTWFLLGLVTFGLASRWARRPPPSPWLPPPPGAVCWASALGARCACWWTSRWW